MGIFEDERKIQSLLGLSGSSGSISNINDVGDVNAGSPSNGDLLQYDSATGKWKNVAEADLDIDLNDLDDTNAGSPGDGDILRYNVTTSKWDAVDASALFGGKADVRLEWTDANTITIAGVPGSSKLIFVADILLGIGDITATLDTDSASDYLISESGGSVSIGSGALSTLTTGYNDYTCLYLYLTNNNACWNFSSPTSKDYRKCLIISDKAPDEAGGHMAASGEGSNARHMGWVALDSSREMTHALMLASAFNQTPTAGNWEGSTTEWQALATDGSHDDLGVCANKYVMMPVGWSCMITGEMAGKNEDADTASVHLTIRINDNTEAANYSQMGTGAGYTRKLGYNVHYFFTKTTSAGADKISVTTLCSEAASSPMHYEAWDRLNIQRIAS